LLVSVTIDPGTTYQRSGGQITVTGSAAGGLTVTLTLGRRSSSTLGPPIQSGSMTAPGSTPTADPTMVTVGPIGTSETWSKGIPCSEAGEYTLKAKVEGKDVVQRDITVT
jgi:hypothetical protein